MLDQPLLKSNMTDLTNNDVKIEVKEDVEDPSSSSKNESSLLNPKKANNSILPKSTNHTRYGSNDDVFKTTSSNTTQTNERPSLVRRLSSTFTGMDGDNSSTGMQLSSYVPSSIQSVAQNMQVPFLSKQLSSNAPVMKETFFCYICYCNQPVEESFVLSKCYHKFCKECIKGYWNNRVTDGQVHLKCFYPIEQNHPCNIEVAEKDILALLDEEMSNKFKKFKINLENPDARQCPYCDTTNFGKASNPIIECSNCYKSYCFFHANAHPITESCDSYESRRIKENQLSEKMISEECKQCPNEKCNFYIHKRSGCNHMKCAKCSTAFCWLCLEIIDDKPVPDHYKDPNSKCKGKQFEGMEGYVGPPPPMWLLIFFACLICIFGLPAFFISLILGTLCFPLAYCGGCCISEQNNTGKPFYQDVFCFCWLSWLLLFVCIVVLIPFCILRCIYGIIRLVCPCLPECPGTDREAQNRRMQDIQNRIEQQQQQIILERERRERQLQIDGNGTGGSSGNTSTNVQRDLVVNNNTTQNVVSEGTA